MKLYFLPGACSLAPHILLREAGVDFEPVRVGRDKRTADGQDFRRINPFGYVPALVLDDGEVLTENPAVLQYVADLRPEAGLAPPAGTMARYRLQSALGLINSEIHKSVGALFNPALDEAGRKAAVERIEQRLGTLDPLLAGREWMVGERFGAADAYLYVVLGWLEKFGIDIRRWPSLAAHNARVHGRESVKAARAAEEGAGAKA